MGGRGGSVDPPNVLRGVVTPQIMLSKMFFGRPKKMALGVRKWPFLAKNFKFWPKMAIFSGPKIFKKNFFFVFSHFRPFLTVFNENEKKFGPFIPQCTQSRARTHEQARLSKNLHFYAMDHITASTHQNIYGAKLIFVFFRIFRVILCSSSSMYMVRITKRANMSLPRLPCIAIL